MLKLQNISFAVGEDAKTEILSDVSLDVEDRGFVAITGPNGGGKSTLAKLIAGVEAPTGGTITWNGEDITPWDITQRARAGIGYAFQQPVRFKGLSVRDILSIAAGRELSVADACAYLSEVGLCAADYVGRELDSSLSGGEIKRIEIATLIARGTKLAVFDEPEAGIDLWSFHSLIRVFERMRSETNSAIVVISHQERILEIADRIVVIANGNVTANGPREEILPELLGGSETCRFYREAAM